MYVPNLKKKNISIVVLEYHGYDVVFSKGNAYIKHVAIGQVKKLCLS